MSGRELLRLAASIEENARINSELVWNEAFQYMQEHQESVVKQLRETGQAKVNTSIGPMTVTREQLEAAVA